MNPSRGRETPARHSPPSPQGAIDNPSLGTAKLPDKTVLRRRAQGHSLESLPEVKTDNISCVLPQHWPCHPVTVGNQIGLTQFGLYKFMLAGPDFSSVLPGARLVRGKLLLLPALSQRQVLPLPFSTVFLHSHLFEYRCVGSKIILRGSQRAWGWSWEMPERAPKLPCPFPARSSSALIASDTNSRLISLVKTKLKEA